MNTTDTHVTGDSAIDDGVVVKNIPDIERITSIVKEKLICGDYELAYKQEFDLDNLDFDINNEICGVIEITITVDDTSYYGIAHFENLLDAPYTINCELFNQSLMETICGDLIIEIDKQQFIIINRHIYKKFVAEYTKIIDDRIAKLQEMKNKLSDKNVLTISRRFCNVELVELLDSEGL